MSMTLIQHIELGSAQASITFNSIPQTFTDLVILISSRTATTNTVVNNNVQVRLNGSTTGNSTRELFGTGSATGSASLSEIRAGYTAGDGATANTFGSSYVYIPNYTSNVAKSVSAEGVSESNVVGAFMAIDAGLWTGTSAVTSIVLVSGGDQNFLVNTSATLYGIRSGSSGGVTVS